MMRSDARRRDGVRSLLIVLVVGLALTMTMAGETPRAIGAPDLLAYWPFEEGAGATETSDATGNGHDGTIHRAEWTENGCHGWGLRFAGKDVQFEPFSTATYVATPFRLTQVTDQTELTLSSWFKSGSPKFQAIMGYYAGTDLVAPVLNLPQPDDVHFNLRDPSVKRNTIEVTTGLDLDDDEWHHVAFRRKSDSELDVFVDGVRQTPKNVVIDDVLSNHDQSATWFIGAWNDVFHGAVQFGFNGTLDDVRIYGRALSDEEVAAEAADSCDDDPPIADAGGPYLVAVDEIIQLDGSNSSDPEGAPLSFAWDYDEDGLFDDSTGAFPDYSSAAEGIFSVALEVADPSGATGVDTAMVVVFDPDGGFVTGGGTIESPAGSYQLDPSLSGAAHFGFVSKYKKGTSVPTGQTEFQFQVADLNFHSVDYDWLVVAGPHAKFKGSGTINGDGDYGFMVSVTDAKLTPSTSTDRFRIEIWDRDNGDAPVFDNETGAGSFDDPGPSTEITGGSIVIHKP